MRILIIGAGATGGFYGGKLALAGRDVTFLVRERRAEQLRRIGLVLRTPTGELSLTPRLVSAAALPGAGSFDLIILSVKAYTLQAAMDDFAPAVGPNTTILPLLNGMAHFPLLSERFGADRVVGGFTRIVGDLDPDGRVLQLTKLSAVIYGELSTEITPRIQAVDAALRDAGFDAVLAPDIHAAMWLKWILIASTNTINFLSHGHVGQVANVHVLDNLGTRFANRVLDEAISVAQAYGYPPDQHDLGMLRPYITSPTSRLVSSMYRDYNRGFQVEAMQILGDLVARARARTVDTPLLEAAYLQLRIYEQEHGW